MRKSHLTYIFLFILTCSGSLLQAQAENDEKIDSLRKVLFTQKGEARAHTLFQLGLALSTSDIDQSLSHLKSALLIGKEYNDEAFVAKCNMQLASNEIKTGKWTESLGYAVQALPFFEDKNDSTSLSRLYGLMGNAYNDLGLDDQALKYQLKALEHIDMKSSSPKTLGPTYNNVANIYTKLGERDKAKEFYERSLKIFKDAGDTVRYVTIMNNMSASYTVDEVEVALDTLNKALEIVKALDNPNLLSMVYYNIAYQNTRSGEVDEGEKYLKLSKEAYQQSQFRYLPPQFLLEEASIFRNREQYDSAEHVLKRLLGVAEEQNMLQFKLMAYDQLGSLYKEIDNSDSALHYVEIAGAIRDSLEKAKQENLLAGLKIDNEFSRKQEQLDQRIESKKEASRQAQIRYWVSMGLMLLIIGGLVYYIIKLRQKSA